ncbi:MAG: hypothetical protein WD767_07570 [Alphaproteobacteria bacterium]
MRHNTKPALCIPALCVALLFALVGGAAAAADRPIKDFYGEYVGRSLSGHGGDLEERDINVIVSAEKRGFNVSWSTISAREGGELTRKSYSISFRRTNRENIYQSAMRTDVFGNEVPNNPMQGDPYVWARIAGDTLSVYALIVTDSGSYDMQVYHRTLTPDGMKLRFSRTVEGEEKKIITGELKRVVN